MEREIKNDGRVMTEEQMEILRKQIAVYATICDQLVLLHNSLSPFHPLPSGRDPNPMGGGYYDPRVGSSSGQSRGRWSPKSTQLQILERIYNEGKGTPNPQRIIEITAELSEHGEITEKNVSNWFQNRRARSKRKQPQTATEERMSFGDSGGLESYDHILFPTPDLGIEDLLNGGKFLEC